MQSIKDHLTYCPVSGKLFWKIPTSNRVKIGEIAGKSGPRNYLTIRLHNKRWLAHHLAWFLFYGEMPSGGVDHRNGDGSDNRIDNLRLSTQQQNTYNARLRVDNTSGFKGVYKLKSNNFQVKFNVNKVTLFFGTFDDIELANFVAEEARRKYHGNFACNK